MSKSIESEHQSQAIRPTDTPPDRTQTGLFVAMILIVSLIIGALYLAQATVTANMGTALLQLQSTRDTLERANGDLESQIALKKDIALLTGRANELGFIPAIPPDQVKYLVVDNFMYDRATATPVFTPTPAVVYEETFNGWVQEQWQLLVSQFEAWAGQTAQPTPVR